MKLCKQSTYIRLYASVRRRETSSGGGWAICIILQNVRLLLNYISDCCRCAHSTTMVIMWIFFSSRLHFYVHDRKKELKEWTLGDEFIFPVHSSLDDSFSGQMGKMCLNWNNKWKLKCMRSNSISFIILFVLYFFCVSALRVICFLCRRLKLNFPVFEQNFILGNFNEIKFKAIFYQ